MREAAARLNKQTKLTQWFEAIWDHPNANHLTYVKFGRCFTWLKWKVDGSEKVTLSPSADDTAKLINALEMGNSLLVEITPYSQSPVEVNFDLNGFTEKLDELKVACK